MKTTRWSKKWPARRRWLPVWLLLLPAAVPGQQEPLLAQQHSVMRAIAELDTIGSTGFYRIVLPPALVAKCRADLSDLRLVKPDGTTVPYVLRTRSNDRLNAGYLALPNPTIVRKDSSNKHSYYKLQYDDAYRIDRLSLSVSDPVLYKRDVRIMAYRDSAGFVQVANVSIDPHDTAFLLPGVKTHTLLVDVTNDDNPPLTITRAASAQSGIYILTYLVAISHYGYVLETGLGENDPPDYDLHYFTDSLSRHPLNLGLQPIHLYETSFVSVRDTALKTATAATAKTDRVPANRRSGILLWVVVSLILLLLIYVSVRLARAVDNKDEA